MSAEGAEPETQNFLSKLYNLCERLEMESPKNRIGITSSRQISEGQSVQILIPSMGVYRSEVVKNTGQYGQYFTVSRPLDIKITTALKWQDLKVSIYFWREEDAGYMFETDIVDEVFSRGISSLKVEHSDALFRTQKRKSLRIKLHRAAFLYLVEDDDEPNKIEKTPGLNCLLEDISNAGCAIKVKGQAFAGLRLKVQFLLEHIPVCMTGTVRSANFTEETNHSLLHVKADPLSLEARNLIMGKVFQLRPEEDEDVLPVRISGKKERGDPVNKFQEAVND
jgi:c-di-GMP-binding flagellar brake protein YcgR